MREVYIRVGRMADRLAAPGQKERREKTKRATAYKEPGWSWPLEACRCRHTCELLPATCGWSNHVAYTGNSSVHFGVVDEAIAAVPHHSQCTNCFFELLLSPTTSENRNRGTGCTCACIYVVLGFFAVGLVHVKSTPASTTLVKMDLLMTPTKQCLKTGKLTRV